MFIQHNLAHLVNKIHASIHANVQINDLGQSSQEKTALMELVMDSQNTAV